MCKVTLTDEDGMFKSCLASHESPNEILEHFHINPETKIIYLNGQILSREKMKQPIPDVKIIHIAIKTRIIRV